MDFALVRYAIYADGELVETNDPEIKPDAPDKPVLIKIGEGRAFPKEVESKLAESETVEEELGPERSPFGQRDRSLIRVFDTRRLARNLGRRPKVGDTIRVGNSTGRVIHVDRQNTIVDFNHPLAGKKIKYVLKLVKRVEDEKELVRRLVYQYCDAIKPDEVEISDEREITLPKGRLECPGLENLVVKRLKERNLLREMSRKKPVKPERLERIWSSNTFFY